MIHVRQTPTPTSLYLFWDPEPYFTNTPLSVHTGSMFLRPRSIPSFSFPDTSLDTPYTKLSVNKGTRERLRCQFCTGNKTSVNVKWSSPFTGPLIVEWCRTIHDTGHRLRGGGSEGVNGAGFMISGVNRAGPGHQWHVPGDRRRRCGDERSHCSGEFPRNFYSPLRSWDNPNTKRRSTRGVEVHTVVFFTSNGPWHKRWNSRIPWIQHIFLVICLSLRLRRLNELRKSKYDHPRGTTETTNVPCLYGRQVIRVGGRWEGRCPCICTCVYVKYR